MRAPLGLTISSTLTSHRRLPWISFLVAVVFVVVSVAWALAWRHDHTVSAEGRYMESSQVASLLAGSAIFAWRLRRRPRLEDRLVWWGLALFLASLASRELEVRLISTAPAALIMEKLVRVGIGVGWVRYGFRAVPRWPELLRHTRPFLTSRCGVLFMIGSALYLLSWVFDRHHLWEPYHQQFIEEVIECHATLFMMLAGVLATHTPPHTDPANRTNAS